MKSFLFTIKNPHNLAARIFEQKEAANAIFDGSSFGPTFGSKNTLCIHGQFESSDSCSSNLSGKTYANNTGIAGNQVLTGGQYFVLKEVEVFQVM
jgi:hypothetical protein